MVEVSHNNHSANVEISHNNHSANVEISHEQSNEPGGREQTTSFVGKI
jgi:hypothetical protein